MCCIVLRSICVVHVRVISVFGSSISIIAFQMQDRANASNPRPKRKHAWINAAVADEAGDAAVADAAVADEVRDGEASQTEDHSIAGDTLASSASETDHETKALMKRLRVQPKEPTQGESRSRGESSWWNKNWEVGNFGLFCGNWGNRGTVVARMNS